MQGLERLWTRGRVQVRWGLPLPWIASEAGWFVAEYGRQPWSIAEILPVHTAVSNLTESDVIFTLVAYTSFYTVMFIVAFYLMQKFARKGPTQLAKEQEEIAERERVLMRLDSEGENS